MIHDAAGIFKIALAALGASVVITLIVGFYESRSAAQRAFPPLFLLCALVGTLQVVPGSSTPYVLAGFAASALLWVGWQRARK